MINQNVDTPNAAVDKSLKNKISTNVLNWIITASIVLIFFLCPLFFTGFAMQGASFEKMLLFYFLVLIGTVAWVTKGVVSGELEFKRTPLDLPIVALIIVYIVSTIFSINFKDSLIGTFGNPTKGLIGMIIFVLFYYLVVNNIDFKRIKLLFSSLIASVSLIIIYSFLQLIGVFIMPMAFTHNISFNPVGSLSSLTMLLVVALPFLIIASAQFREIYPDINKIVAIFFKIAITIIGLLGFVILAFLNGFTFWPVAIVGVVIVLMFFLSKIISVTSNNLVIPLASFLLVIIFLVLGNFNIMNIKLPSEVSLSRGVSWDISKKSVVNNPLLGSGPSTFYSNFSKYKGTDFNVSQFWNVRFDNASGIMFEFLSTVGILGAFIGLVILLIILFIIFLTLIKTEIKGMSSILLASFASYVSVIIFASLFAFNNSLIIFSVIISVFAISVAITLYSEKFKSIKLSFKSSPKYALALATIFLVVSAGVMIFLTMGIKMYLADIYVAKAMVENDSAKKIVKIKKAIALFPYQDKYYLSLSNLYMGVVRDEVSKGKNQIVIENNLNMAIESGKKAIEIAPNKASNNEVLAAVYENASFYTKGSLEWSESLYNKLIELDPYNPIPHLRLALINMARSNAEEDVNEKKFYIEEAKKKYDEAIAKKSNMSSAYYGKAIAIEKLGDVEGAIEELKKAVILTKNNVDYRFELGRLYFNRGVSKQSLSQTSSEDIIANEDNVDEEELSVEVNIDAVVSDTKNDDLVMAEEVFLSILNINPRHANSIYSLALLYQKVNKIDNAKRAVVALLDLIQDEKTKDAIKKQFKGLY